MQPQISQLFVVFFITRFYILSFPPFAGSKGLKLALEIVRISKNWVQLRYKSISQQIKRWKMYKILYHMISFIPKSTDKKK